MLKSSQRVRHPLRVVNPIHIVDGSPGPHYIAAACTEIDLGLV